MHRTTAVPHAWSPGTATTRARSCASSIRCRCTRNPRKYRVRCWRWLRSIRNRRARQLRRVPGRHAFSMVPAHIARPLAHWRWLAEKNDCSRRRRTRQRWPEGGERRRRCATCTCEQQTRDGRDKLAAMTTSTIRSACWQPLAHGRRPPRVAIEVGHSLCGAGSLTLQQLRMAHSVVTKLLWTPSHFFVRQR